jgi:hypothetical protein
MRSESDAGANGSDCVIVVRRGETRVFRSAQENFREPVVWDRRVDLRRTSLRDVAVERRSSDRRTLLPGTWDAYGFLVCRRSISDPER